MTFKRAKSCVQVMEPVPDLEIKPQLSETCKRIVHTSTYDYFGTNDFSNFLLDPKINERIVQVIYQNFQGREMLLFLLLGGKRIAMADDPSETSGWYCNINFARNLYLHLLTSKTLVKYQYIGQTKKFVRGINCLHITKDNIIEAQNSVLTLWDNFQHLIEEFKNWKIAGVNPTL